VVHPLNECDIWHSSDAQTARWAMASAAAPDERALVLVPVCGGTRDGLLDLSPGIEAPAFEGQRAQHLPPRLDEVEVGRVFRLEHELPARVRQSEPQHVHTGVNIEVVEHGVDPLGLRPDPGLDLAQEVDPVRGCAALVGRGEGRPRGRLSGAEHVARDIAPAVVDRLSGPLGLRPGRLDQALPGIALAGLRPHFVEADDYAAVRWRGVEVFEGPLFSANAGSTRAPNQVSSCRPLSPSARSTSLTRLRRMPIPCVPR
jgi:hypothetical protein